MFAMYSHSMRLLELADLLDLVHKVTSIYIFHDKIQSVLNNKEKEVMKERRKEEKFSVLLQNVCFMPDVKRYHGLEARVQLSEERWFPRQSEDSLLHHGALHIIILDHHVLLQDFDGVQLICSLPLSKHHLRGERRASEGFHLALKTLAAISQHKVQEQNTLICITFPKLPFPKTMMKLKSESLTRS